MAQSISSPQALAPEARNGGIDALRWLGAVGIVLFHMNLPGAAIGYAALPLFMVLLAYYGADRPLGDRLRRFLVPWAIWSGIYLLAKIAQALVTGQPIASEFAPYMLLTGPAIHLWFLPFAAVFLAAIPARRGPVFWALAAGLSAAALTASNLLDLPTPLPQWLFVLPAGFLGVALRDCQADLVPLMVGAAALCLGLWLLADWQQACPQLALAAALIALALARPLPDLPVLRWLSGLSMGVYLAHPLFIAIGLILGVTGWPLFAFAVLGAHALTVALRRFWPAAV